jgi:hypothetical protein
MCQERLAADKILSLKNDDGNVAVNIERRRLPPSKTADGDTNAFESRN